MASLEFAPDDIIGTWDEAEPSGRPPLAVLEPLVAFLDERGIGDGPISVSPLGDGHSNVTLLLVRGDRELVLRRPPRPPVAPSAHDVLREASIVSALAASNVPVARVVAVGTDEAIIGAPFYVMDRSPGVVVDEALTELDAERDGAALSRALIDTLVAIHAVDWQAVGLAGLARSSGYVERQIRRFRGLWELNKTRDLPEFDAVAQWLVERAPASIEETIVHGDYRLGNSLFSLRPPGVTAVLDWEMSAIGDPLADVGFLLAHWSEPGDAPTPFDLGSTSRLPGFLTRQELLDRYVEQSGREVEDINFYMTLAVWKSIVYMEGNYKRASAGASDDPFLMSFGDGVVALAERAYALGPGSASGV